MLGDGRGVLFHMLDAILDNAITCRFRYRYVCRFRASSGCFTKTFGKILPND